MNTPRSLWTTAETLIGGILVGATGIHAAEADDGALTDVALDIHVNNNSCSLALSAVPENDAIAVAVPDDLNE